jgi:hypothetical protein
MSRDQGEDEMPSEKELREAARGRYDEEGYCPACGEYVRDTAVCAAEDRAKEESADDQPR